ncbi:MAG: DsbA family protein [Parvularculaceae bacterium]
MFTVARTALLVIPMLLAACGGASSKGEEQPTEIAVGERVKTDDATNASDMYIGKADAPVTVLEFASVTCPHCADFSEAVLPKIKEKYIDTGKVKLVFREFPTPPQGLSFVGSVLARCAAEKGGTDAYFMVVDTLFRTQQVWISDNAKAELQKIAAQIGMDQTAFEACLQRQDLLDLINANVKEANEVYNINAVPSFIINGVPLSSAPTIEAIEKALEDALAKSGA